MLESSSSSSFNSLDSFPNLGTRKRDSSRPMVVSYSISCSVWSYRLLRFFDSGLHDPDTNHEYDVSSSHQKCSKKKCRFPSQNVYQINTSVDTPPSYKAPQSTKQQGFTMMNRNKNNSDHEYQYVIMDDEVVFAEAEAAPQENHGNVMLKL
jgi:hypothetical protein